MILTRVVVTTSKR
ncbi:hypothetical protein GMOD_00009816 [Pyrenophora seminiperda CCB06]|uniref:Uncharacterized protein n=1 Tax=Pyrenophora seminiperda CCB06 TaxID=1302712 RepID=A0A3M7ME51_9PLEO|nr:hypothetical protein GMOD_00009816 [Pyrenophora seminiperda CCB06]